MMTITSERQIGNGVITWPSRHRQPVTLQTLKDDYCNFCVRFGGNGRYFKTFEEAAEYVLQRFNINLRGESENEKAYYQYSGKEYEKRASER